MIMLTGCPSPGGNDVKPSRDGGAVNPGNPGSPERTLSFTLELSEPSGKPLELGSGPSLTTVTSDAGTTAVGTVRGKTYPITVTQVPPNAAALTLTVRKKGFLDTAIGPITIPPKGNPPPQTKTIPYAYTTSITGKVVTPARAADPAKGAVITTAQVWASTDPGNKVTVDPADDSYTLEGVRHSGTFTITADYTAADGNYKTGAPQTVTTIAAAHTKDIALKYGYTTTLSGITVALNSGGIGSARNGVTLTAAVEDRVVGSTTSSGTDASGNAAGNYRITISHPGTFRVTASFSGLNDEVFNLARLTAATHTNNFVLSP